MHPLLQKLPLALRQKLIKKKMPAFEKPMLATLTQDYFSDDAWVFERKFDGERCLAFKNGNTVFLKTRNNKDLNQTYPEIIPALKKLAASQIIIDGEIVAFQGSATSFEKLQSRIGLKSADKALATGIKIYVYVFDILYLDGYSLVKLPLLVRKTLLKKCITFHAPLRYTTHKNTYGKEYRIQACKKGWEGIIAKRRDSIYVHKRSTDWLKFKCGRGQELVIGGYTDPKGSRVGLGALLMGYYKKGKLYYAGKVGTGFSDDFLAILYKKLKAIESKKSHFTHEISEKNVHFVRPLLVAEIGFEEWTKDNKLRHPRFLGLRDDKNPKKVIKE